jgi:hypothetical protein
MAGALTGDIRLVAIGAGSRERWEAVVRTDANVNILQTPIWCDCICRSEGLEDVTRSYESSDGRLNCFATCERPQAPDATESPILLAWPLGLLWFARH